MKVYIHMTQTKLAELYNTLIDGNGAVINRDGMGSVEIHAHREMESYPEGIIMMSEEEHQASIIK